MAQSINYFKNMVRSANLLFKIIQGRLFLGLPTYMEEIQCTGMWETVLMVLSYFLLGIVALYISL